MVIAIELIIILCTLSKLAIMVQSESKSTFKLQISIAINEVPRTYHLGMDVHNTMKATSKLLNTKKEPKECFCDLR